MKLTRRQGEFVKNLHELNREMDGPIHYSILAERLGVSPFTAYDMLCLLEEKGLATSEYQLANDKSGPGRAERVFYPTIKAHADKQQFLREAGLKEIDEESISHFFMERLRSGNHPEIELAEELLARIPPEDQNGDLRYCMEVMAVIALRLRQSTGQDVFLQFWPEIIPEDEIVKRTNLSLIAGFAFGILARECSSDPEWVDQLFEHVNRFLDIVARMSQEECGQLGIYLAQFISPLARESIVT